MEYTVTLPLQDLHRLGQIRLALEAYEAALAARREAQAQLEALGIAVAAADRQIRRTEKAVRDLGPARIPGFKKDGTPRQKPGRKPKAVEVSPLAQQSLGGYAIKRKASNESA